MCFYLIVLINDYLDKECKLVELKFEKESPNRGM